MAFAHGKNLKFSLDNAAGTLVDLSAYIDDVGDNPTLDTAEVTNGASGGKKQYLAGLEDGTFSIGGPWDPTLHAHIKGVMAALRAGTLASASVEYGPAGGATGQVKETAEVIITSYESPSSVDDAVRWTAELQVTGGITSGVFS